MFNAEKLLGTMLKDGLSRGGMGKNMKAQVGLGLLGLAIGAMEHFANKPSSQPPAAPSYPGGATPPPPPGTPGSVPPVPPAMATQSEMPPSPPPIHPDMSTPPPPPGPPPVPSGAPSRQNDAVLLIRAMIAAANADGMIDQEERQRILDKFRRANLSPEEQNFLAGELLSPASVEQLTAEAHSMETARQIYAVSLLAITVDTDAERIYLQTLAQRLGLSAQDCDAIHRELGITGL